MALSRRKNSAVPAGSRSTAPGGGAGAPNDHQDNLWASAKPTSWQARATHPRPQTGAQRLAKGSPLCPRMHGSHGRTSCFLKSATRSARGWVDVRGCLSRSRFSQVGRSSPQPWIQTRPNPLSLQRQSIGACLATCPGR